MTPLPYWVIGSLGMIAVEASYLPQIARLARRKSADDVSLVFPLLNLAGRLLALGYSVAVGDRVFVAGFVIGACLRGALLVQVAYYRRCFRQVQAALTVRS